MCGIVGGLFTKDMPLDRIMGEALETIKHRGPNDTGYKTYSLEGGSLALGHTRLSIIDLSAAGHQPMHSDGGRYSIVFNGEIYNYKEIRNELKALGYRFNSDSDTEVLVNAWAEWQAASLPKITGMFAFVVLDQMEKKLTCIRDAFGIKPLYYRREGTSFLFASETPALLKLMTNCPILNYQKAYDYLVYGNFEVDDQSFYKDVLHLMPGHYIELDLNDNREPPKSIQWWQPEIAQRSWNFEDATKAVREEFLNSIRLHLRSDVSLGAAVSGGIDSSAVACAIRHVAPKLEINTFSYIAKGSELDEEEWVDKVNEFVGAVPHKVTVDTIELADDLDELIRAQGEPFGGTSIYAQYRVFKLARESGVTVILDGQGADEMLAGYSGYPGPRLKSLIERGRLIKAVSFLNKWSQWPGRKRSEGLKKLAGEWTHGTLYKYLRYLNGTAGVPDWVNKTPLVDNGVNLNPPHHRPGNSQKGRRLVAALAHSLTTAGLPALLRVGDRNSMAHSIESRVPFLTINMVNLLLSMPEKFLVSDSGETKHIFRAAMKGIVPEKILERKDKIGFATPEKELLLAHPKLIRSWLSHDIKLPFFKQNVILDYFEGILKGTKPYKNEVWRWINFIRWHQLVFSEKEF